MRDKNMANELVCTWVAVTDQAGRAHMEARWTKRRTTSAEAA